MSRIKIVILLLLLCLPVILMADVVVDINSADHSTIAKHVKGVGDKKALEIVRYREKNGLFSSVDELVKVKGIGRKTVEANRKILTATQQ